MYCTCIIFMQYCFWEDSTMDQSLLNELQNWAIKVNNDVKANSNYWEDVFYTYANAILDNFQRYNVAREKFKNWKPWQVYVNIKQIKNSKNVIEFSLCYLGQKIGIIKVANNNTISLVLDENLNEANRKYFGLESIEKIVSETPTKAKKQMNDWSKSDEAKAFRKHFKDISSEKLPRQKEHMIESALRTELGKTERPKTLCGIKPISFIKNTQCHMKTAISASKSCNEKIEYPSSGNGGDIDILCRRRTSFGKSRLTVIEVKDENKKEECFDRAIKQAISYAVFLVNLIHSKSGEKWMKIWGLQNQPKENLVIDAVVAMKTGETKPSYSGEQLLLKNDDGTTDSIELHYIEITSEINPEHNESVRFETSMKSFSHEP